MRQETEIHFLVGTVILGILFIFRKSQESSPYEILNLVSLSRGQKDVRPPVQRRRTPTAFSRVSTGDSNMPSSCEMKDELELIHCREIMPSFELGPLRVHSTRDRKQRVRLTSVQLRENSS